MPHSTCSAPRPIVWYISGHGFGHASREIEIINVLHALRPDIPITVRTGAKRWIFDLTLREPVVFEPAECDTGIVQIDSLRLDEAETIRRAAAFYDSFDSRVREEADRLRALAPALVVGDVPPLAFAAAHAANVPSVAIANFTWDWIYEAYEPEEHGASGLLPCIREACAHAGLFLRLPLWGGFGMARPELTVDLPLVARRSERDPADTRRALGLPQDRTLILLSFGGHGLTGLSPRAFDALDARYVAVVTGHVGLHDAARQSNGRVVELDERTLYDAGWRYEDLVAAVDVVATKPGYGIIAECAANDTALLYTSRGHFIEYEVLIQEMPAYVRSQFIPQENLFAGDWDAYLEELLSQDRPEPADVTGARRAADLILDRAGLAPAGR